ncbi:serine/threonine protein kinase, CMGC, dual-specificity [Ciborinia camelliae]|nr:serine/threonine protein kinase, CMGC, dual-specificity [Ciborinia camelliae]
MIREQRAPSGPRPDLSPTRHRISENYPPGVGTGGSRLIAGKEPTLHPPPRNHHTLFTFGGHNEDNSGSYDFLPSPSFDDLQTSISNELQLTTQFPASGGGDTTSREKSSMGEIKTSINNGRGIGGPARGISGPRPARTSSFQRRQSVSNRQGSISSTASSTASGNMDPPSAPLAVRTRRNQYPPISGSAASNAPAARIPRKSAGGADADYSNKAGATQRRRPSLAPSTSLQSLSDIASASARMNTTAVPSYMDGARGTTASRAAKSKSLQPPIKGQPQVSVQPGTPDHSRSSSLAAKSPGKPSGTGLGATTPSSATSKRISALPGTSHASGLGARTISPTDTRRAKRLSTHHGGPIVAPGTPPTPQPDSYPAFTPRGSSRSPSMLPRKVPTPSSSRTTPDSNRKYNSAISAASSSSCNTSRNTTGSLQPRLSSLAPTTSRLPTPKSRNVHSSAGNNEEEDVPPVPAIPKAYESPKDSPAETPFYAKRKSSMPFDASSINSTSTNSISGRNSAREPIKNEREPKRSRHAPPSSNSDLEQQKQNSTLAKKKNLQPLRLPPLNLLPLSAPTAAKAAAISNPEPLTNGALTPPPKRINTKTPSSPMTASKTSFFSRRTEDKPEHHMPQTRSNSSIHHRPTESSSHAFESNAGTKPIPIANNRPPPPRETSPYLSSSLPKNNAGQHLMPRSKTSGDFLTMDISTENKPARLTGPRALKVNRLAKSDTPAELSSPEDPPTPSSASSLRRKLSLGWKRSGSKTNASTSHAAGEREANHPPPPPKHDNMPPPRLPASSTMNNLSSNNKEIPSPSPSVKSSTTTYLNSSRRKSSVSSLNVISGHDRTKSDSWGLHRNSPKKEASTDSISSERNIPTATSRTTSSVMHRMLNPKASSSSIRHQDHWTADLDKDDLLAEEEMKKLGNKRKETEQAARQLDALRKRATPKDRANPQQALKLVSHLNIYEKGEIVDYKDIYFCGTASAAKHVGQLQSDAANFGYDDDRGDYQIATGDHLSYRYEIIDVLGKGSFGQVVRCIDHKTGGLVAIKIIRNKKRFHQQALVEVNILQKLREWDPKNKHSMVNFVQSFYFRGHLCISTELLDMNLYELIKSNAFRGFSLKIVRRFTKQMLSSLLLLKSKKVIHCDLKPENILLAHPIHSEIKVIDFGSSCFENEKVYTYIQSRFYRSPEVILGMTYGMPIDMWSLGCILAELYTGVPIFPGENEQEQLACIMEVFGPPEKHLIEKSTRKKLFFDSLGKPRLTVSSKGRRRRPSSRSLQQTIKCDDEVFLDFLARCLRWDPEKRMKPDEAVRHEFITGIKTAAPPRFNSRIDSPIKRHNTTAAPSSNRPLPEPPSTSYKSGTAARPPAAGNSPSKALPRRQSNVTTLTGPPGPKRTSTGNGAIASSSLPRVTRSVSSKQDIASAGASAAMSSRRVL